MLVLYKSIIFHMCSRQTKAFLACMYKHLCLIGCAHLIICKWAYHYTNITRISMRKCLGGKFHLFLMSETSVSEVPGIKGLFGTAVVGQNWTRKMRSKRVSLWTNYYSELKCSTVTNGPKFLSWTVQFLGGHTICPL
jgi:hypothetical protein